jgi:hypothetical protein
MFNVPLALWKYTNWPFPGLSLFGVPGAVFLAWVIQYVLLLSLYRALFARQTAGLWD